MRLGSEIMAQVKMLNFSATEIVFENNLKRSETFELSSRCSYNLGFSQNRMCRGEMVAEVFNKKTPEDFKLRVKVVGNFIREDDSPQDDVHKTTYKMLFPHVKALLTSISVTANIPPIFFPDINIDEQSVYMIENPKK